MAYDKYTWQTGEVITQEKLNHMEDGIEDAYELPAVTETDNGKVLGVDNGQFGLVEGGGSGGHEIKVLNKGDWSSTDYDTYKRLTGFAIDITNGNEIKEAFIQGQEVFFVVDEFNNGTTLCKFVLTNIMSFGSSSNAFMFSCLRGRYVSYISLSFSKYPPTYGFIEAYANSKDLFATK